MIPLYINQEIRFFAEERASACSKNYFFDGIAGFSYQALKNCGMFTVYRNYRRAVLHCQLHHNISRHNQGLFISQGNKFSLFYRFQCGFQSGKPYYCRKHDVVAVKICRFLQRRFPGKYFYISTGQCRFYAIIFTFIADHNSIRCKFQSLFDKQFPISLRS